MQQEHLKAFENVVGSNHVFNHSHTDIQLYGSDWTKQKGQPAAVVFPKSTAEVSAILAYCHQHKIAVVPSGGRTGLAGGAVAPRQELVISMGRMNKIIEVDKTGLSITAEAGVITQSLQDEAKKAGLFFPIDLASKGSCHIGGNIATNAGGLKLIRYGGMRENVLGVEVVLADGRIMDLNFNLRKNNIGYDLKQLFIGSEGTLGIITKATLKLVPPPKDLQLACIALNNFSDITALLTLCNLNSVLPTAFEFFTDRALGIVLKNNAHLANPFSIRHPFYVLVEHEKTAGPGGDTLELLLEKAFESGLIMDAVIASTSQEFHGFWALRENISESVSVAGHVRKNDIALPIAKLDSFLQDLEGILKNVHPDIEMVLFGHIGDGNLHLNYVGKKTMAMEDFRREGRAIEERVFATLKKYRGSISAEHGIGLLKKQDLTFCADDLMIATMKGIKTHLDPHGIMNPGKIFD